MPRKPKTPSRGKKTKKLYDLSLEDWPENFYQVDVRTGVPYSPSSEPPKPSDDSLAIAAPLIPPHMRERAPNLDGMLEKRFMDLRAQHLGFDERLRYPGVSVKTLFPDMFPSRQPRPTSSSHQATGPSRVAFAGTATPSPSPSQQSRTNTRIGRSNMAPGTRAPAARRRATSGSQSSMSTADQRFAGDQALMPPPPAPSNNDTKWKTYDTPPDESSASESSSDEAEKPEPSVSQLWTTGIVLDEASKTGGGQGSVSYQSFDMFPSLNYISNQGHGVGLQNGNFNGWGHPFVLGQNQQQAASPSWPNANFNDPNQFGGHSPWVDPSLLNPRQGNVNILWPYPSLYYAPNQGNTGIPHIDPSLLESKKHARRQSRRHPKDSRRKPTEEHIRWTNPNAPDPNLARQNHPPARSFPTLSETPYTANRSWSGTPTSAFMGPGFTNHETVGYSVAGAPGYSNSNISPFDPGFAYNNTPGYPIAGAPGYDSGFGALAPAGEQQQQHHPFGTSFQHQYPPPPEPDYTPSRSGSVLSQQPQPQQQQQQTSPYRQGHQPAQPAATKSTTKTTTEAGGHETDAAPAERSAAAAAADDAKPDADDDCRWVPPAGYRHPRTAAGRIIQLNTAQVAGEARRLVAAARRGWPAPPRPGETFARMWQTAAAGEAFRRGLRGPYVVARRFVVEILYDPTSVDEADTACHVATWGRAPNDDGGGRATWLDLRGRPTDRINEAALIDMQGLYELEWGDKKEKEENDDDDGKEEEEEEEEEEE